MKIKSVANLGILGVLGIFGACGQPSGMINLDPCGISSSNSALAYDGSSGDEGGSSGSEGGAEARPICPPITTADAGTENPSPAVDGGTPPIVIVIPPVVIPPIIIPPIIIPPVEPPVIIPDCGCHTKCKLKHKHKKHHKHGKKCKWRHGKCDKCE